MIMVMLSKNRKIYERAILLAAVIVLVGTVALAGITDSASAKARYLTVRCVCGGKTVKGATFDVYKGKKRIANNVKYFKRKVKKGKVYRIKDIRPGSAYSYKGKKTVKVRIKNRSRKVDLILVKKPKPFTVKESSAASGKVTFDVFIGGKKKANDVSSYTGKIVPGTKWKISDLRSNDPHVKPEPAASGTAGKKGVSFTVGAIVSAHDKTGTVRVQSEPSFTEDGISWKTCSICGKDMEKVILPKYTDEISFSKEAGAYPDPAIDLDIVNKDGLEVRYTTDCSMPSKQNGKLAEGGIVLSGDVNRSFIDEINNEAAQSGWRYDPQLMKNSALPNAAVVKACAVLPDGTTGKVYTKTYFMRTVFPGNFGCTVISIACEPEDLLGYERGIFARGKIFKDNFAENMEKINSGDEISVIANYTQKKKAWERPANIEVFNGRSGEQTALFESGCGIRVQGGASRRFSQKSFNIYFRNDYGKKEMDLDIISENPDADGDVISAYKSFTLRNGGNDADRTKFRDAMIQGMLHGLDIETQRAEPAVLFLNGEFFGVYTLNEKYSSYMIGSHYGINKDDIIIIDEGEVDDANDEDAAMEKFEKFRAFFDKDLTQEENWNEFCKAVDIRSLADYYAAQIYIGNPDWNETNMKNYRIWSTVSTGGEDQTEGPADGKWRWALYDTDFSTGIYGADNTNPGHDHLMDMMQSDEYPLFRQVMKNGDFRELLADRLKNVANRMTPERFDNECMKWIKNESQRDLLIKNRLRFGYPEERHFDDSNEYSELGLMKQFIIKRPVTVEQMIEEIR